MLEISAVIITLNEERRLARALESLSASPPIAEEVLVVDSGSTDRTLEIAARYGARVLSHPWEGYARQKNFAASQAKYDWVFSIDADEALSSRLAASLREVKRQGPAGAAGFRMARAARYQGRWIRHSGWYPDWKLRLYDRRRGRWAGDYVHERVELDGPVGKLAGDLEHYTCDSLEEHLGTLDRYTTLAAQEAFANGDRTALPWMLLGPPWKFFETFIFRQGFRDGFEGFVIAVMAGYYVFRKYAKLRKLGKGNREWKKGEYETGKRK
jgi:glycosyltransferase involved in cell wall biosynthesis